MEEVNCFVRWKRISMSLDTLCISCAQRQSLHSSGLSECVGVYAFCCCIVLCKSHMSHTCNEVLSSRFVFVFQNCI